jgi:hypothetical protein
MTAPEGLEIETTRMNLRDSGDRPPPRRYLETDLLHRHAERE